MTKSPRNLEFTRSLECFDDVLTYDPVGDLAEAPSLYTDFLGDADLSSTLRTHLGQALVHQVVIDVTGQEPARSARWIRPDPKPSLPPIRRASASPTGPRTDSRPGLPRLGRHSPPRSRAGSMSSSVTAPRRFSGCGRKSSQARLIRERAMSCRSESTGSHAVGHRLAGPRPAT